MSVFLKGGVANLVGNIETNNCEYQSSARCLSYRLSHSIRKTNPQGRRHHLRFPDENVEAQRLVTKWRDRDLYQGLHDDGLASVTVIRALRERKQMNGPREGCKGDTGRW